MIVNSEQAPIEGTSFAYTFDDENAKAPSQHKTQYFEMMGQWALYHEGWLLSTKVNRAPWEAFGAANPDPLTPGKHTVEFDFKYDGLGVGTLQYNNMSGLARPGIGSLIGGGTGRDVAMVLGAVGGAVAGNEVQKKYDAPKPGQKIIVHTPNGVLVSVTQPKDPGLRIGEEVYIEGNGENARVRPK